MGIATTAIGLIPDHSVIGIWGGVLLTLLRIVQGIGVGGEWAGAVLLSMEWGQPHRRGFFGSWAHVGLPVGLALGNSALLIANKITGPEFLTVGWRYPFVLSLALIVVGIWVRLGVLETPIFVRLLEERRVARRPLRQVVTRNGGDIVKVVFVKVVEMASYYVFTVFVLSYGTKMLKLSSEFMLLALVAAAAISPFYRSDQRPPIRHHRAQAHVHDRHLRHWFLRLSLLLAARCAHSGTGDSGGDPLLDRPRHHSRAPAGAGCRDVHGQPAARIA